MEVEIFRKRNKKQSPGFLMVLNDERKVIFSCATLELPWKGNERNVSCIPEGSYTVRKRRADESPSRNYDHFILEDVPGRSYILMHTGNFNWHIKGCILVGEYHKDINKDGLLDVFASLKTLIALNKLLPETFNLTIKQI